MTFTRVWLLGVFCVLTWMNFSLLILIILLSRSSSQPVWAGSSLLPASCVPAASEAQPTSLQTPPPLPLWPSARAPCATPLPPPLHLSPSLPSSSTTPPPPPTAHNGLVRLTACRLHTRPLHRPGLYLSAPPSPWAPTPPRSGHRARFPGRGRCRLCTWPTLCRSQSATQEDPTWGPRRAGREGWFESQLDWTRLDWTAVECYALDRPGEDGRSRGSVESEEMTDADPAPEEEKRNQECDVTDTNAVTQSPFLLCLTVFAVWQAAKCSRIKDSCVQC